MQTTEVKPAVVVESYPEMPEAAQILSKARAYLSDPAHWIKDDLTNGKGGMCALGAIQAFGSSKGVPTKPWECLSETIPKGHGDMVSFYNNESSTTHADLLAWFDRAIALALEPSNAD